MNFLRAITTVVKLQLRARRPLWVLLEVLGLIAGVVGLSIGIQYLFFAHVSVASQTANLWSASFAEWLLTEPLACTLVLVVAASAMGAGAAPTKDEAQSAYLTQISLFSYSAGRLVAALLTSFIVVCVSCTACVLLDRYQMTPMAGVGGVLTCGMVQMCAVGMVASVSFLFASTKKSGWSFVRGTAAGLALADICLYALFAVNSRLATAKDPARLIEYTLAVNPVAAAKAALNQDVIRDPWVYDQTLAGEYPYSYPSPMLSGGLFAATGFIGILISAVRLKRGIQ